MDSTLSSEFTRQILTWYSEVTKNKTTAVEDRNLDCIVLAIQFFNQHDYFVLPSDIYFLDSGDLVLQWSSAPSNDYPIKNKMCQIIFSRNKTLTFSKFDFDSQEHSEILNFEHSFEYNKKMKEFGIKILNYLDGNLGTKAFSGL